MRYIKEPAGVDFYVDPTPLSTEERKRISEIIAHYKATRKKVPVQKVRTKSRSVKSRSKKSISVSDYRLINRPINWTVKISCPKKADN